MIIGLITKAVNSSLKTKLQGYKEVFEDYMVGVIADKIDTKTIYYGRRDENGNLIDNSLKDIIQDLDPFYEERMVVMRGDLYYCYKPNDGESSSDNVCKIAKEIGLKVIRYGDYIYDCKESVFSRLNTSGNNSYYMCTPDLSGFNEDNTFFVKFDDINDIETMKITKRINAVNNPNEGWYDYLQKKWANLVTINNGAITYWVWIPRYAYNASEIGSGAGMAGPDSNGNYSNLTVKFINFNNEYWDGTTVDSLGNPIISSLPTDNGENWVVPDAFEFDGKSRGGFWMSKFEVQEKSSYSNYSCIVDTGKITVKNLVGSDDKYFDTKYMVSITDENGTEYGDYKENYSESDYDTEDKVFNGLTAGKDYNIKIYTRLKAESENYVVLGWSDKVTMPIISGLDKIKLDVTGYTKTSTFIELYEIKSDGSYNVPDSNTGVTPCFKKEISLDNIKNGKDSNNKSLTWSGGTWDSEFNVFSTNGGVATVECDGKNYVWFDYSNKVWANIKTNNNSVNAYWTYIPRYEYIGDKYGGTTIKFIGTETTTSDKDYIIPDAFKVVDDKAVGATTANPKITQLNGIWMSKYEVQQKT